MDKNKLLIVDDEEDFLELIKARLEDQGYEVITASRGDEALEKLGREEPDAVLLDILMPGLNGLQILWEIRREHKDLPIFIITAFSTKERFELARKLNASGFIAKTGNLKKEVENITRVLKMAGKYKS